MKNGNGGKWSRAALMQGYATHSDAMPHDVYVDWQRECLREIMRVLTPEGAIFLQPQVAGAKGLLQTAPTSSMVFPVRQIIIWQRSGGFNHNPGYFLPTYEVVYLIASRFPARAKAGGIGDVWRIRQDRGNLIRRRSRWTWLDEQSRQPLLKSSWIRSLAAAPPPSPLCWRGRQFIGIDVSGDYCELARQRVDAVASELAKTSDSSEIPSALEVRAMLQSMAQPAEVPNPDP